MGEEIDQVRKRIGVDRLETGQRKKLFRDFVEHGGQVVEEDRNKPVRTESFKPLDRTGATRKKSSQRKASPAAHRGDSASSLTARTHTARPRKKTRKKNNLKIYLTGLFLRVFAVNGKKCVDRFLDDIRGSLRDHFTNLTLIVNSFLKGNWSVRKEIMQLSIGENSLFFEILFRLSKLYEEKEYEAISKSLCSGSLPSGPHVEIFKQFFKRSYILGQYTDLCKLFIQKAVDLQVQAGKLEKTMGSQMKSKLKAAVNGVLIDTLPKLHILLCRIANEYLPLYSQRLDDYLGLTDQDRIGYITREERRKHIAELKRMKEYMKRSQMETDQGEQDEVKVPRHVERGLVLLNEALERYEKTYLSEEGNNPYVLVDENDKLYKTGLLLDTFEKEYSFILSTGKISFNIDYQDRRKIDVKEDLNHAYLLLNEARHQVNEYVQISEEIFNVDSDSRLNLHQKSTMLESLEQKRSVLSKTARNRVMEVMGSIHDSLSLVINDYNDQRRLLQNPEDRLDFTEDLESVKRMHGKKIIEAVVEGFLFASALHFLLAFGELAGSGLSVEKEIPSGTDAYIG
jgi:hypothetical protein